jgi:uncharacterized membrane protein YfcA
VVVGLLLAAGGFAAGAFGALLGLGGGILIVPLLTVGFGVPFRAAVGISLVCVIVTSSAAAGVYLERRVANMRLGMFLELFTATGALVGGLIAFALPVPLLEGLFAALLFYTAWSMIRRAWERARRVEPRGVTAGDLADPPDRPSPPPPSAAPVPAGSFTASLAGPGYQVGRLPLGVAGSLGAGVISALLGVGGGIVKVPLMNLAMGLPLRAATATSNMMIGITAAASATVYLMAGAIDPYVAGPTAAGVFVGALVAARVAPRVDVRWLHLAFVAILLLTAVQMIARAVS